MLGTGVVFALWHVVITFRERGGVRGNGGQRPSLLWALLWSLLGLFVGGAAFALLRWRSGRRGRAVLLPLDSGGPHDAGRLAAVVAGGLSLRVPGPRPNIPLEPMALDGRGPKRPARRRATHVRSVCRQVRDGPRPAKGEEHAKASCHPGPAGRLPRRLRIGRRQYRRTPG